MCGVGREPEILSSDVRRILMEGSEGRQVEERLLARLCDDLKAVDVSIRESIASDDELCAFAWEHALTSPCRRFRPMIFLLVCELCEYEGGRSIPAATALSVLQLASLLHADVVEHSESREGEPTANALWGDVSAVQLGDLFLARAFTLIMEAGSGEVTRVFTNACRGMAEGSLMERRARFDSRFTQDSYTVVVELKSALQLSAACEVAAIIADVTPAERMCLSCYGRELGFALHLRESLRDLGLIGEAVSREPPFRDLRAGRLTLPLLVTRDRCNSADREFINTTLETVAARGGKPSQVECESIRQLVARHGSAEVERIAAEHAGSFDAAIADFRDCFAKRALLRGVDLAPWSLDACLTERAL